MNTTIRQTTQADRQAWGVLFQAYAEFGNDEQTPEMQDCVWGWIHDKSAQTICFVVENEQKNLVGFVHFRSYERPLPATKGAYIDDMYVAPDSRGLGTIDRLIESVGHYAAEQGWDVVRWMTSETNYRARAVYDRHAVKTKWVTYELKR
ncbi:MAG: GNAT family N-acetyltransferase [Rhodobacteraceae bacterium]|nr:GNAT family N-acetyltransferase [Paracoccaceae bacterium]